MSLPTNCSIVVVSMVEVSAPEPEPLFDPFAKGRGVARGTPIFEDREGGPYRAWMRTLTPDEYAAGELAGGVDHFAKVYLRPGPEVRQSDSLEVGVDGQDSSKRWEVVSVRERLGPEGLHHIEVLCRRVVEGR